MNADDQIPVSAFVIETLGCSILSPYPSLRWTIGHTIEVYHWAGPATTSIPTHRSGRKCQDLRHARKIVSNYLIHLDDHPDDPDERYIRQQTDRQTPNIIQN